MNKYNIDHLFKIDQSGSLEKYTLPEFEAYQDIKWCVEEYIIGRTVTIDIATNDIELKSNIFKQKDYKHKGLQVGINIQCTPHKNRLAYMKLTLDLHNLLDKIVDLLGLSDRLPLMTGRSSTFYFVAYGKGIRKGTQLYCFDKQPQIRIMDVYTGTRWSSRDVVKEYSRQLDIETPPYVGHYNFTELIELANKNVARSNSSLVNSNARLYGYKVYAPYGILTRNGKRLVGQLKASDLQIACERCNIVHYGAHSECQHIRFEKANKRRELKGLAPREYFNMIVNRNDC